ncbi:hypothetical protein [Mesorhizobium carmichaelinearum]|uniref:hypothetical protein n=1 Tax=Mesorhizobium carmichaelinearum TaxID=1208188 RepID=UPI000BA34689|nr:hypothetical protein [Mesorhizobium carmichaelinearum]
MIFFRLRKPLVEVDLSEDEIAPGSLLDRSSRAVTGMLERFRSDEVNLEKEIADLTERLRQTRIAIVAFESAGAIIEGGKVSAIAPDPDKVGRLVPRGRGSVRAIAEADIAVDGVGRVLKSKDAELPIVHVHKDIRACPIEVHATDVAVFANGRKVVSVTKPGSKKVPSKAGPVDQSFGVGDVMLVDAGGRAIVAPLNFAGPPILLAPSSKANRMR